METASIRLFNYAAVVVIVVVVVVVVVECDWTQTYLVRGER